MAKGLRSKYKRRLRNARAEHHWETRGKARLDRITDRLNNPHFQMKDDFALKPNAFLHPDNPNAEFPQVRKPDILDFRSHKMEKGGLCAIGVFRKHLSKNAKKSRWETVVKTRAELDAEEKGETTATEMEAEETPMQAVSQKVTKETMDELMAMTEKMALEKKRKKSKKADADMDVDSAPKVSIKSKAISKRKKKDPFKKSKK